MLDTIERSLSSSQLDELKRFGARITKFGANFAICSVGGEAMLLCDGGVLKSRSEQLMKAGKQVLERSERKNCVETKIDVCRFDQGSQILGTALRSVEDGLFEFAALIHNGDSEQVEHLSELLSLFAESYQAAGKIRKQSEKISGELTQVYEELVLLHKLSENMKINESSANYLQMSCDSLTDIVAVEGIAILLEKTVTVDDEMRLVVMAGSGLIDIDEQTACDLHQRLTDEIAGGKDALVDSEVDDPFKYDWMDNIKSIMAVPLYGKTDAHSVEKMQGSNDIIGLMVAINRIDRPDFDSIDIKLFNSVASSCAVFVANGRLFGDLKELFIGSLRALTSSIDAKDKYTRGHSERVAFISRWIAERPGMEELLDEEQIHRIYLAGLLHDIGKVGVDEAVLRKKDKLTDQEFGCIKTHPSVGASILSEIRQMRDIVPGVLYHHERTDGKGYPNGLPGEQIPLMAKIIQLADSFDAMTSKRSYRDAMTVEQAIEEVKNNLGSQFDEKIGRIFINSDISQLWSAMEEGFNGIYVDRDFSEYGAIAVGTLIR